MHPLASITSDSQEQRRLDSSSLNDSRSSPDLPFSPSSPSPAGGAASLPPADDPILICSLPDTPSSATPAVADAADIRHLGLGLPEAGTEGKSAVTAHEPFAQSPSPALVGEVRPGGRLVSRSSSNRWKKKCRASRWQLRRRQIKSPATPRESPAKGDRVLAGEVGSGNNLFENYRFQPREAPKSTTRDPSAPVKLVPEAINPSAFIQNLPSSKVKALKPADREDGMLQEVRGGTTGSLKASASVIPGSGKSSIVIQNPPLEVREAGSTSVSCGQNPPPPSSPSPVASLVTEPQLSLLDIIKMSSKEPDMKYANTDLLEIMAMKGIEILPPQWWRSGGYDDLKHSISE